MLSAHPTEMCPAGGAALNLLFFAKHRCRLSPTTLKIQGYYYGENVHRAVPRSKHCFQLGLEPWPPSEGAGRAPAAAELGAMPGARRSKVAAIRSCHQSSARVAARQGSD